MNSIFSFSTYLTVLATVSVIILVRTVVVTGAAGLFLRTQLARMRRVYARGYERGQLASELRTGLLILLFDCLSLAAVRASGLMHLEAPALRNTLITFGAIAVWFEIWFYATHRLMHTRALYFIHAQHHVAKVTSPLTSMSFSLAERVILLIGINGFAIALSRVMPISMLGLMVYVTLNFVLNVWGHLNVELMPAGFARSALGKVFITTSFHAMHHARYQGHYGLYSPLLDRLLGTEWKDYPEVQERAATGHGLTTLGERIRLQPETEHVPSAGRAAA